MAVNAIPIVINLTGAPGVPNQSPTWQIVTPWGQTIAMYSLEEALYNAFQKNSRFSGKMGSYFQLGTLLGANFGTPTTQTGTLTVSTNTITGLTSTAALTVGQQITSSIAGLALGTWITGIVSSTSVSMNNNFTGTTGSATITFFPVAIASASDIDSNP